MSAWDTYVDSVIGHCKDACDRAVLVGLEGAIWSAWCDESGNDANKACPIIKITAAEAMKIASTFANNQSQEFHSNGVTVEGIKYQFLKEDDNVIYAKKKDHGCLTMQKCKKVIIIAHTKDGGQHGDVNQGVAKICEHLEGVGF